MPLDKSERACQTKTIPESRGHESQESQGQTGCFLRFLTADTSEGKHNVSQGHSPTDLRTHAIRDDVRGKKACLSKKYIRY